MVVVFFCFLLFCNNLKHQSTYCLLAANRGKAAISSPTSVETPLQQTYYSRPSVEAAREQKTVGTVAILDFPAKQDIVLKIKDMCHLERKTPEQMPFKLLSNFIQISRYEDKSEMVSLYGGNFEFPAKQDIVSKKYVTYNTRLLNKCLLKF